MNGETTLKLQDYGYVLVDAEGNLYEAHDGATIAGPATAEERRELADYMIQRWQRWAGATAEKRAIFICHASTEPTPSVPTEVVFEVDGKLFRRLADGTVEPFLPHQE